MEQNKSWEIITKQGEKIQKGWNELACKHDLKITISGIPALSTYSFNSKYGLEYKTYNSRNAEKGFLVSTIFYVCIAHTDNIIDTYLTHLDEVLFNISECEKGIKNISNLLDGPVCHSGFKRLN